METRFGVKLNEYPDTSCFLHSIQKDLSNLFIMEYQYSVYRGMCEKLFQNEILRHSLL